MADDATTPASTGWSMAPTLTSSHRDPAVPAVHRPIARSEAREPGKP